MPDLPSNALPEPAADAVPQDVPAALVDLIARSKSMDPSTISPASTFEELGIDSLDRINLSFDVEELFKIQIPDESLNSLRSVGDVITGVERLLAEKSASA